MTHIFNERTLSTPYTYGISEGNIPDHKPWSKIGFHAAIDTTELEMMPWASAAAGYGWKYPWPTGALTMTLVSSSVEDDPVVIGTGAVGTGAHTVTVYYLTTGFVEKNITVTLNGQAAVAVAADIYRVQNMRVATCGTAGWAVGNLRLATATPQTTDTSAQRKHGRGSVCGQFQQARHFTLRKSLFHARSRLQANM
jgi:hypothetical protein